MAEQEEQDETGLRCSVPMCDRLARTYVGPDESHPVCGAHFEAESNRLARQQQALLYQDRVTAVGGSLNLNLRPIAEGHPDVVVALSELEELVNRLGRG